MTVKIRGSQIKLNTITNDNIADSTIELGKLVVGNKIVLNDGSVAFVADLPMNGNKIIGLADPADLQDAVTKGYADGKFLDKSNNLADLDDVATARTNLDVYSKSEVDTKLTGVLDYSGTIDLSSGDVSIDTLGASLTKGQFYKISGNGNITSTDGTYTLPVNNGDMVIVNQDVADTTTVNPNDVLDKIDNTEASDILRTSDISTDPDFTLYTTKLADRATIKTFVDNSISASTPNEVFGEKPTVTDGSADVTLANTPTLVMDVYLNGLRETGYTVSGNTITFDEPLVSGDEVVVNYRY